MGKVIELLIAESAGHPMEKRERIQLEAGKGIVGDRYYNGQGTFSERLAGLPDKELTLIESEEVDRFNKEHGFSFSYGDFRRNVVTRGIKLNQLEGKEFTLGDIRLRGVRLCEPCAHLTGILVTEAMSARVMPALAHKSGLRARIIDSGSLQVGDKFGS